MKRSHLVVGAWAVVSAWLISCSSTVLDDPASIAVGDASTSSSTDSSSDDATNDARTDAAVDAGPRCAPPLIACDDACVDPRFDPSHCGGCTSTCAAGELCSQSACGISCLGGSTKCGATCADLRDDPTNCGSCSNMCGANAACINGVCALIDPQGDCLRAPNLTLCYGSCVDTTSDATHCGNCSNQCFQGQVCTDSTCVCADAGATTMVCSNRCTDTSSDSANCGGCGATCLVNQVCVGSACECAPNFTTCSGICRDLQISANNCGGCGGPCAAGNLCTKGSCSPAMGKWQTLGSDAQHTGKNPDEIGAPPAIDQWSDALSSVSSGSSSGVSPAVIENGVAFVTYHAYFSTIAASPLVAIDVSDGSQLWSYNFGEVDSVGFPTVVDGTVYVQTVGNAEQCFLWAFDAATGNPKWSSSFTSQWATFWSPLVVGSTVYIDGGEYGGLYGFNTSDGNQIFFNSALDQDDQWSPAFFNGNVYTFMSGHLRAHDASTGATLWTVTPPLSTYTYSAQTAPVFGPSLGYAISNPSLYAFDPSTQTVAWTANGAYSGIPAYADGVVYGFSGGNLVARNATNGNLLWSFTGDGALANAPAIANGYVYVSSPNNVYAVSIATHASTWSAPVGGWLAIASGRLLVSSTNGNLTGFVLTQ